MSIHITQAVEQAYKAYLDEAIDHDLKGVAILRSDTYPYLGRCHIGIVDFTAGYQAAIYVKDAEIAALRLDAERYRWLRENEDSELPIIAKSFFWRGAGDASPQFFKSAKETDAAIDEAIAQAVQ